MYISSCATPTNEEISEEAKVVVLVDIGVVPVIVNKSPVTVTPLISYVPLIPDTSPAGKMPTQPIVGV